MLREVPVNHGIKRAYFISVTVLHIFCDIFAQLRPGKVSGDQLDTVVWLIPGCLAVLESCLSQIIVNFWESESSISISIPCVTGSQPYWPWRRSLASPAQHAPTFSTWTSYQHNVTTRYSNHLVSFFLNGRYTLFSTAPKNREVWSFPCYCFVLRTSLSRKVETPVERNAKTFVI